MLCVGVHWKEEGAQLKGGGGATERRRGRNIHIKEYIFSKKIFTFLSFLKLGFFFENMDL